MTKEYRLRKYYITLEHDNGVVRIMCPHYSQEEAVAKVLRAEGAPESAIIEIENSDEFYLGPESPDR